MIWVTLIAVCAALGLGATTLLLAARFRQVSAENVAWRSMAKERADRVATLGHEVRTPLALIGGSAEVLQEEAAGELSVGQRELVDTILVQNNHVQMLANDLLVDAKLDAEFWTLRFSTLDLGRLVRQVVRDLRQLSGKEIEIRCPRRPMWIHGDAKLLRQVFVNLINNSVNHAGLGATIMVEVRPFEDSILISVADDGEGISDESKRQLLAQKFKSQSETGLGIGLSISRRIVRLHGGHCLIDSVVQRGTAILVSLPKEASDD